jgi:hypothetical protein
VFVIAIIAILIGLLLPAVRDLRAAAQAAQQFAKLQPVADSVLRVADESFDATLERAAALFDASLTNHTLPDRTEVATILQTLTEKARALKAARTALPEPGRADDSSYRTAYLNLLDTLDDTIDDLHKTTDRLSELLRMMEQMPR